MLDINEVNQKYTEEVMLEEENEYNRFYTHITEKKEMVLNTMDSLLQENSKEAIEKIIEYYSDPEQEFEITYMLELKYFKTAYLIYKREAVENDPNHIFSRGMTVEEIMNEILELKFILWQIEFEVDTEGDEFIRLVTERQLSRQYVLSVLFSYSFDRMEMLKKVISIYQKHKFHEEAAYFQAIYQYYMEEQK